MLKVCNSIDMLDFRQLMDVYEQSNRINGALLYPELSSNLQSLYAEQDFYYFLKDFFAIDDAQYFLWVVQGNYKAALRVEPYLDGHLLEGLETAMEARRKGYATQLIQATLRYLKSDKYSKIYSHIAKDNRPSLMVHQNCGFQIVASDAEFINGEKHLDHYTLVREL